MLGKFTLNIKISINWLLAIIVVALSSVAAYVIWPAAQGDLAYGIAVLGGIGVLITAFNDIDLRRESLQQNRLKAAFAFSHEWNNPDFHTAKSTAREALRKLKAGDLQFVNADPQALESLIGVLNFIEVLSMSVQTGEADEAAAKRFFRGIVVEYWQHAENWIKNRRAEKANPRLFCEAQFLYEKWAS